MLPSFGASRNIGKNRWKFHAEGGQQAIFGHSRVEAGGVECWGQVVCIDYHATIGQWTGNSPDDREAVVEVEGSKLPPITQ